MDKFPRGSLPPTVFVPLAPGKPDEVERPPTTIDTPDDTATAETPRGTCDLATTCPNCNTLMQPEHAHYRCLTCGYRDSCCF